jgi:hypothetical protein
MEMNFGGGISISKLKKEHFGKPDFILFVDEDVTITY